MTANMIREFIVPLRINYEDINLQLPLSEAEEFNKLINDNEYTLQYVRTLMITGAIKADRIFLVQRVFNGEIETVYEEQQSTENLSTVGSQQTVDSQNSKEKTFWGKKETLALISILENKFDDLHHVHKRKHLWDTIVEELRSNDIMVDAQQCRNKWNNLVRTYKGCIDSRNSTGRAPTKFAYFDRMAQILGDKPNYESPPHCINSVTEEAEKENDSIFVSSMVLSEDCAVTENNPSVSKSTPPMPPAKKPKKKNFTSEYVKMKRDYYENKSTETKRKNDILERKILLQERCVLALEELVKLKKQCHS